MVPVPISQRLGVRRDTTSLLRGWRPKDLADVATRLPGFEKPVLIVSAPSDRFFKIGAWPWAAWLRSSLMLGWSR